MGFSVRRVRDTGDELTHRKGRVRAQKAARREASGKPKPADALTVAFQPPERKKITFLLSKPPVSLILLWH